MKYRYRQYYLDVPNYMLLLVKSSMVINNIAFGNCLITIVSDVFYFN